MKRYFVMRCFHCLFLSPRSCRYLSLASGYSVPLKCRRSSRRTASPTPMVHTWGGKGGGDEGDPQPVFIQLIRNFTDWKICTKLNFSACNNCIFFLGEGHSSLHSSGPISSVEGIPSAVDRLWRLSRRAFGARPIRLPSSV